MILVTGVAGFIGMHLARRLLADGRRVIGADRMGGSASEAMEDLKRSRLSVLHAIPGFDYVETDIASVDAVARLFRGARFSTVLHLAAQTGVRNSTEHPHAYIMSNMVGFANILDQCRRQGVSHLVYASSSSIYGANTLMPYSEHHATDHPISVYAATKKSNELLAHSYSHLHGLATTGLRFFTVYGPWGRPDMAPMLFADAILHDRPIALYNGGRMLRDFTYIDDVVESIVRILRHPPKAAPDFDTSHPDPAASNAPYRIYNVGNQHPVGLIDFVETLEQAFGRKAHKVFCPMQAGDVQATCADTSELARAIHWTPSTPLETGVARFVEWHRSYYA